jgi:hypothetical protein
VKPRQGKKPGAISGFKSNAFTSGLSRKSTNAQALIREDVDVGSDLKSARRHKTNPSSDPPPAPGFMKPAGIDAPPDAIMASKSSKSTLPDTLSSASSMSRAESIVQLAKSQAMNNLRKRNREEALLDEGSAQVLGNSICSVGIASVSADGTEIAAPKVRRKKKKSMEG